MVLSKLLNINLNLKILIIFTFLTFVTLILSLIVFPWYNVLFYSFLYGFLVVYFSIFLIWLVTKFFKIENTFFNFAISLSIRFVMFLLFLFIGIYAINSINLNSKGVELLLRPINIFIYLLAYSFYYVTILLIPFYEWFIFLFLKQKNNRNINRGY